MHGIFGSSPLAFIGLSLAYDTTSLEIEMLFFLYLIAANDARHGCDMGFQELRM
jgi:hypothetical protein